MRFNKRYPMKYAGALFVLIPLLIFAMASFVSCTRFGNEGEIYPTYNINDLTGPTVGSPPEAEKDEVATDTNSPSALTPINGALMDNGCSEVVNNIGWCFIWTEPEGDVEKYNLKVQNTSHDSPVIDEEVSTRYLVTTLENQSFAELDGWTWQVRAYVDGEWGEWSKPAEFKLEAVNADCPVDEESPEEAGGGEPPAANDVPFFSSIAPSTVVTIKAVEGKDFVVTSHDKDGDPVQLSVKIDPLGANNTPFPVQGILKTSLSSADPKIKKWNVKVTPTLALIGKQYSMSFTLNDGKGGVNVSNPITFTVESAGEDPPSLTLDPPPNGGIYEMATGASRNVYAVVKDADFGDDASLVCTELDGEDNISYCGWSSTYGKYLVTYHAPEIEGDYQVKFTATPCPKLLQNDHMPCCEDNNKLACCTQNPNSCTSQTVTFAVSEPPEDNHAPAIVTIGGMSMKWVPKGCTTSYEVTVIDQDGDDIVLSCSADSFCSYVSFDHVSGNNYLMNIAPHQNMMDGDHDFYIQAHDGTVYSSNKVVNVHVYSGQCN